MPNCPRHGQYVGLSDPWYDCPCCVGERSEPDAYQKYVEAAEARRREDADR